MRLGVSYIAAHLPHHIESDMKYLKAVGCTEVLFALQENHIVYLTGALKYGARIAKESGLRAYAVVWGYANTFGGGRMSIMILDNPNMWCVTKDGERIPRACLNNPKLVDRFIEITDLCRSNGYEGVFVDEPTPQECFCPICCELFRAKFGGDLSVSEDTPEYVTFRTGAVHRYTESLCKKVKALDPTYKTMACIMPCDRECFELVAAIPELDIFGTDPYWILSGDSLEVAIEYTRQVKDISIRNGKSSQVWLNCWAIPAGREMEIYTGGKALAEVGCDSLYTWSFRGGLGTNEECARPDIAWLSVERLYKELHD